MLLVTKEEMRALEAQTMSAEGVAGAVSEQNLMETAGQAVATHLKQESPGSNRAVLVLCGPGNNGGDGFVVARSLASSGWAAEVLAFASAEQFVGAAAAKRRDWEATGGSVAAVLEEADIARILVPALARSALVVDCLLGTGVGRPVAGVMAVAIALLNVTPLSGRRDFEVVSVDLPSGVDGDTGEVHGVAVRADQTLCLGAMKRGLMAPLAASLVGRRHLMEIGLTEEAWAAHASELGWNDPAEIRELLPRRAAGDHKGRSGHVLVVGSSMTYPGAGILCARGAMRGGAGVVSMAMPTFYLAAAVAALPEAIPFAREPFSDPEWRERLAGMDAVVLGPGLGAGPDERQLCRWMLHHARGPLVVDADALNFMGLVEETRFAEGRSVVLTPHPGEMARLCGVSVAEVQADREGYATWLATRSGAVVILKGAGSLVADPDGRLYLNTTGGPLLASAGTGDVLAGLVAALLAQGLEALAAARSAVFLHGAAADRLSSQLGDAGLLATDLADSLPFTRAALLRAAGAARSWK